MVRRVDHHIGDGAEGIAFGGERQKVALRIRSLHHPGVTFVGIGIEGEPISVVMPCQRVLACGLRQVRGAFGQCRFRVPNARCACRRGVTARHQCLGFVVKFAQQLAFPAIPHAGADGTDIGHRQHQQKTQHLRRLHGFDKIAHGLGIGKIALLCRVAHHQMVFHEPDHGFDFAFRKPEAAAQIFGDRAADFRMIAGQTLGDVMQQNGAIEHHA